MFGLLRRRKLAKQIDAALDDEKLTCEELSDVLLSANTLRISETAAKNLLSNKLRAIGQRKIQAIVNHVFETDRFSPANEEEMRRIAHDLKLNFDTDLTPLASRRFLWEIDNGWPIELQPIAVDLNLNRGEQCFHRCSATWSQVKTVRKREGSVGGAVRFRVAKGVSFSVGKAVPVYSSSEQLLPISDGRLYVTNQRVVFVGSRRSTETKFRSIAYLHRYSDAVEIQKTRGKPDVYLVDKLDTQVVPAMLSVLMQ